MTDQPGVAGDSSQTVPVRISRFEVNVVNGEVKTVPDGVGLKGEGWLLVWELGESARDWEFLGNGIAFEKDDESQFIHPYRFKSGKKCIVFDRNTMDGRGEYKYSVSLIHRKDPKDLQGRKERKVIRQDPIIENEGDG